jgi:hypothetical protein
MLIFLTLRHYKQAASIFYFISFESVRKMEERRKYAQEIRDGDEFCR